MHSPPQLVSKGVIVSLHEYLLEVILIIYYPPEVSSMKYCCLGVFRKEYFRLVSK